MLTIAICDDNNIHIQQLRELLEPLLHIPYQIKTCLSSQELLSVFSSKTSVDLLFMDIELSPEDPSGITLAQQINQLSPETQIIFTSEYLSYAPSVYETDHVYFIDKSHLDLYLEKALQQALCKIRKSSAQYLRFTRRQSQYHILQSDILYLERVVRLTEIHTVDGTYSTSMKISELSSLLSSDFCVCHRSYIVNLSAVKYICRNTLVLNNDQEIPISRSHSAIIKEKYAQFILNH